MEPRARRKKRMIIFVGVAIVVILFFAVGYVLTSGTLYFSSGSGYRALHANLSPSPEVGHKGRRTDLARLLPHLLEGRRFDSLTITQGKPERGFSMSKGDGIEFTFTFNLAHEKAEQAALRKVLSGEGLSPTADYDVNVGMGPNDEERMITVEVPADTRAVQRLAEAAMTVLFDPTKEEIVFDAIHHDDLPGRGITWRPQVDRLAGLLDGK